MEKHRRIPERRRRRGRRGRDGVGEKRCKNRRRKDIKVKENWQIKSPKEFGKKHHNGRRRRRRRRRRRTLSNHQGYRCRCCLHQVPPPPYLGGGRGFRCLFATNCRKGCEVAPEDLLVGTTCINFTIDRQLIRPGRSNHRPPGGHTRHSPPPPLPTPTASPSRRYSIRIGFQLLYIHK